MGAAVRYQHALYVFSVLDENRAAVPVLYLITSALSHLPIFLAIMWLRRVQPDFDPCAWMMDDSKAQQKAIYLLRQRGIIRSHPQFSNACSISTSASKSLHVGSSGGNASGHLPF
jgi:hypothetical protein